MFLSCLSALLDCALMVLGGHVSGFWLARNWLTALSVFDVFNMGLGGFIGRKAL